MNEAATSKATQRLVSLDAFRGAIMISLDFPRVRFFRLWKGIPIWISSHTRLNMYPGKDACTGT